DLHKHEQAFAVPALPADAVSLFELLESPAEVLRGCHGVCLVGVGVDGAPDFEVHQTVMSESPVRVWAWRRMGLSGARAGRGCGGWLAAGRRILRRGWDRIWC